MGTSLASHHFRSPSAGRSFIRIRPVRIHPLPFACSPWTFRSPVQAHVSFQLHFSAGSALHWSTTLRQAMVTLYFSLGFSSRKVLLLWHFSIYKFLYLALSLQFRDYGGSLAHRLQARFLLYAAGMYISRFAEEGSRTFFLLTSLQIRVRQRSTTSQRRFRSQFSRYFTVNSTFETLGEALHIVSNLAFSHMQLECTFFFC